MAMGALDPRQIARGLRRIVYGWKGPPPNLPDFMRLCRSVGNDDFDEGPVEVPRLAAPEWQGDAWEIAANQHLLAHLVRRATIDRAKYTAAQTAVLVTAKKSWAVDMRDIAVNGQVPVETQRAIWRDYIEGAEGQCA
jgi:hypothetical protein